MSRTIGPQTARLLDGLYDRSGTAFTLADVQTITGLPSELATGLVNKAIRRGVFSRLKGGLYTIVPPELAESSGYSGNPLLTARHLASGAPGFISHAAAMELHRMVTQPQLVVHFSSPKRIRSRVIGGTEFRFVLIKPAHMFGTTRHWATKQEFVEISDLERTILDGLRQPEYCGGVTEVAKGLWMRRDGISIPKMVDYSLRLDIGAVTRRLGYLLELYQLGSEQELESLRAAVSAAYVPLDPTLPRQGRHHSRWRIQSNIAPEELLAVRGS